mmetsp:Transcript_37181/g.119530  ORF Transcript_37181/g.119530 Transcript_37181/m.119530 type:complete len:263 (+) Transcript_37181:637-1425(+)
MCKCASLSRLPSTSGCQLSCDMERWCRRRVELSGPLTGPLAERCRRRPDPLMPGLWTPDDRLKPGEWPPTVSPRRLAPSSGTSRDPPSQRPRGSPAVSAGHEAAATEPGPPVSTASSTSRMKPRRALGRARVKEPPMELFMPGSRNESYICGHSHGAAVAVGIIPRSDSSLSTRSPDSLESRVSVGSPASRLLPTLRRERPSLCDQYRLSKGPSRRPRALRERPSRRRWRSSGPPRTAREPRRTSACTLDPNLEAPACMVLR